MAGTDRELVEWLRTQLDAHEADARSLLEEARRCQHVLKEPRLFCTRQVGWHSWPDVERLASGVLADIAAKRLVLDECWEVLEFSSEHFTVESCDEADAVLAQHVVRRLAARYADRPGYLQRWRPPACTFEAETWRRTLTEGGPPSPSNGMLVDVVDRDNGVQRLVYADGEWLPTGR